MDGSVCAIIILILWFIASGLIGIVALKWTDDNWFWKCWGIFFAGLAAFGLISLLACCIVNISSRLKRKQPQPPLQVLQISTTAIEEIELEVHEGVNNNQSEQ